jgi:hypothetical protein
MKLKIFILVACFPLFSAAWANPYKRSDLESRLEACRNMRENVEVLDYPNAGAALVTLEIRPLLLRVLERLQDTEAQQRLLKSFNRMHYPQLDYSHNYYTNDQKRTGIEALEFEKIDSALQLAGFVSHIDRSPPEWIYRFNQTADVYTEAVLTKSGLTVPRHMQQYADFLLKVLDKKQGEKLKLELKDYMMHTLSSSNSYNKNGTTWRNLISILQKYSKSSRIRAKPSEHSCELAIAASIKKLLNSPFIEN